MSAPADAAVVREVRGVYDTAVQRGGWSCSTVVLQLGLHAWGRWPSTRGAVHRRTAGACATVRLSLVRSALRVRVSCL